MMSLYELKNLDTELHVVLAEAVMSRIVVSDKEAGAFQTVLNVVSNLRYSIENSCTIPMEKEEK